MRLLTSALAVAAVLSLAACGSTEPDGNPMTFFVTSAGRATAATSAAWPAPTPTASAGRGRRRGRPQLARLPQHQRRRQGGRTPRDRIGTGPWHNAKGEVVADSVDELHGAGNNLTKQTALTEKGAVVNGRGDTPNMHDILTGSTPEGRAAPTDVRRLDLGRRGRGHRRPQRPHRARRVGAGEVVELVARRRAAAGRTRCSRPAGRGCCTASRRSEPRRPLRPQPFGKLPGGTRRACARPAPRDAAARARHLLAGLLWATAFAAGAAEPYSIYEDGRHGFSVEVPAALEPRGETEDGAGRRFASRDGDATAWMRGSRERPCTALGMDADPRASEITYRFARGGVTVVSGYRGGRIYYDKAVSKADGRCLKFHIEYDRRSRRLYDPVTTRMANSFGG